MTDYTDDAPELVSFAQWLEDMGIYPDATKWEARMLLPAWDAYGQDYIRDSKAEGKDYEVLPG